MTNYLLEDVLCHDLKIVFCGTALGKESFKQKAYYAKKGNQFWPTLARVGLTPRQLSPQEYPKMLEFGYGLTDMCKTAFGNDSELPDGVFNPKDFEQKILHYQPKILAFTSKRAASEYLGRDVGVIDYGLQAETIGNTQLYVLSSPSGLARRWWREDVWEGLANATVNNVKKAPIK